MSFPYDEGRAADENDQQEDRGDPMVTDNEEDAQETQSQEPQESQESQEHEEAVQSPPAAANRPAASSTNRPPRRPRRSKNSPEPDYSAMVQNQMSATNRTGQACDRCKGRKMKCDSNPTGCANCIASESPCTQTDPITKVSSTRGELERLRLEVRTLRDDNQRLREALRQSNELLQRTMGAGQARQPPQGFGTGGNMTAGPGAGQVAFQPAPTSYAMRMGFGAPGYQNPGRGFAGLPPLYVPPQRHPSQVIGYPLPNAPGGYHHTARNVVQPPPPTQQAGGGQPQQQQQHHGGQQFHQGPQQQQLLHPADADVAEDDDDQGAEEEEDNAEAEYEDYDPHQHQQWPNY